MCEDHSPPAPTRAVLHEVEVKQPITLEPVDEGTLVRLTHTGLAEGAREPHEHGWNHYMDRLAIRAVGGDPGPDHWMDGDDGDDAKVEA